MIQRRSFIQSLTTLSAALLPGSRVLAELIGHEGAKDADLSGFLDKHAFRFVDHRNLLSLDFYFINTTYIKSEKAIVRKENILKGQPSFMIVRLPQQHIQEAYIEEGALVGKQSKPGDPPQKYKVYATTNISGFSYLVFKILFDPPDEETDEVQKTFQKLPLSAELMNWNSKHFQLVVRQNLNKSIFQIQNGTDSENTYPFGFHRSNTGNTLDLSFDRELFPKVNSSSIKLLKHGSRLDAAPVTALEIPYGLILSPQLPDQDNYRFKWRFPDSDRVIDARPNCNQEELWMACLQVQRIQKLPEKQAVVKELDNPSKDLREKQNDEGDGLMRLMMIGSKYDGMSPAKNPEIDCFCVPTKITSTDDLAVLKKFLPTPRNYRDLVKLYIEFKLTARTNNLTFSPLGVSTNIHFINSLYNKIQEADTDDADKINLYQWDQSISFGKDQEIKVAEVVMEGCFGLKMLHIRAAKRQTFRNVSVLVYREFLKPLDTIKDYLLYNHENSEAYLSPNYKCNTPFRSVEFAELDAKQISPICDMTDNVNIVFDSPKKCYPLAYWPIKTTGANLTWKFKCTDWDGNVSIIEKNMFILTAYLGNKKANNALLTNSTNELIINVSPEKPNSPGITPWTDFKKEIDKIPNAGGNNWVRIQKLSEDFDLQQLDHYRTYLQAQLTSIENNLRSYAGKIEDEVIEQFGVYKRRVVQVTNHFEEQLRDMTKTVDDLLIRITTADAELQGKVNSFKESVQSYLDQYQTRYNTLSTDFNGKKATLKAQAEDLINKVKRIPNYPAGKLQELRSMTDRLATLNLNNSELEKEYTAFLDRIPRKLKAKISSALNNQFDSLHQCLYQIRNTENSLKSKINLFKTSINYAVSNIEEDLENAKALIQKNLGEKWEEEYEKLRNAYFASQQKVSRLQTDFIVFKNNIRQRALISGEKILDFFHEYATYPQLHTAQVYVQAVNDLVHREIPIKIKYAEDYVKNQVHEVLFDAKNNVSRVFAEIKSDARERVKAAVREITQEMGGIANMELHADFLTLAKDVRTQVLAGTQQADEVLEKLKRNNADLINNLDAIKAEINTTISGASAELLQYQNQLIANRNYLILMGQETKKTFEDHRNFAKAQGQEIFKRFEDKILGSIRLKDIIGEGFELPKLDHKNGKIVYNFLTNKLRSVNLGLFSFKNIYNNQNAQLAVYLEKPLNDPKDYVSFTTLENFEIGIFQDRLLVAFDKLRIYSSKNVRNQVTVSIANVKFQKELAFLDSLSKNIKIPGTGLTLNVSPQGINVTYAYTLPSITGGAFTLANLKFGVGLSVPLPVGSLSNRPVVCRFGVNSPADKFVVAAGIWGGRGHFILESTPKYITTVDCGIDFGGYLALDLGIAKGEAFLMAGIRYVYSRDDMGETKMEFYAIITCGGSVTVFGFITLSVVFVLCLRYQQYRGASSLYGTASVTYSVQIGFFKKSFSLTFSRRLAGTEAKASNANRNGTFNYDRHGNAGQNIFSQALYRENKEQLNYAHQTDYVEDESTKKLLIEKYDKYAWRRLCGSYKPCC